MPPTGNHQGRHSIPTFHLVRDFKLVFHKLHVKTNVALYYVLDVIPLLRFHQLIKNLSIHYNYNIYILT